ncbi:MAG: hypothetical protein ACHQ1H_13050, partial [Nitrososphaerales archaeon]
MTVTGQDFAKNAELTGRLDTLSSLCREILKYPHIVREYASIAGPHVITALAELDRAFSITKAQPQPAHTISATTPEEMTLPSRDDSGSGQDDCRPTLPPITDTALEAAVFTHPGVNNDLKTSYDRLEILG